MDKLGLRSTTLQFIDDDISAVDCAGLASGTRAFFKSARVEEEEADLVAFIHKALEMQLYVSRKDKGDSLGEPIREAPQ